MLRRHKGGKDVSLHAVNNELEFVLVLFHFNAGGIRLMFQLCYIPQVLIVGKCWIKNSETIKSRFSVTPFI